MRTHGYVVIVIVLGTTVLLPYSMESLMPTGAFAEQRNLIAPRSNDNVQTTPQGGSWIGKLLFSPWLGRDSAAWTSPDSVQPEPGPKVVDGSAEESGAAPRDQSQDLTSSAALADDKPDEDAQLEAPQQPAALLNLAPAGDDLPLSPDQDQAQQEPVDEDGLDDDPAPDELAATSDEDQSDDLLLQEERAQPQAQSLPAETALAPDSSDDLLLSDSPPAPSSPSDGAQNDAASDQSDDLLATIETSDQPPAGGGDDLLSAQPAAEISTLVDDARVDGENIANVAGEEKQKLSADEEHLKLFVENRYPSANTCGVCHPKHFREWSVSQHSYAQLSPIYLSLNNKINQLSNGSDGDFCLRCHNPVGSNLGESPFLSNLDRHPTSREGITCVVCHRIDKAYNKVSGRIALVEGGLTEPVYGPTGNAILKQTLAEPDKFRVVTDPDEPGRQIHTEAKLFQAIQTPTFCGSCHDVTLFNGFRLEEAFSEYRTSPAAAEGVTCQDCHMGKIQGQPSGYEHGPAAVVGDVPTTPRKITNHMFSGPDYSIIHPGIFPHNQEATAFKTMREWLQFRHKEGWGTDKFENAAPASYKFPKAWQSIDDRYDARAILNKQFELLALAKEKRREVLRNGFVLGDIRVSKAGSSGIAFQVQVRNGTNGHNVPTGFTGERLVWLDVKVSDAEGRVVFRSGDRDPNGDVRDGHSSYVRAGKVELDAQLFSLQSLFVTQNGRGGEIEHVIPIPFPSFALPRVLPSTASLVFTGEPATERNHKKGIEPNGSRWASYSVSPRALTGNGPYTVSVKLKAQAVPINLVTEIQDVGFDFGMTPREVGDELIAGTQILWQKSITLEGT